MVVDGDILFWILEIFHILLDDDLAYCYLLKIALWAYSLYCTDSNLNNNTFVQLILDLFTVMYELLLLVVLLHPIFKLFSKKHTKSCDLRSIIE